MEQEPLVWLVQWLEKRNPGLKVGGASKLYDDGLVDSFGIIELLEETEGHFSISFDDGELSRHPFRTVDDFAGIIKKKTSEK